VVNKIRTERAPRDFGSSERPQRSFDGERKPYAGGNSDRPQRSFDGNSRDGERRSFDRPQRTDGESQRRPHSGHSERSDGNRGPVSRVKSFFTKRKD